VGLNSLGVESGPSAQIEMPRPFVFTRPVTLATVGRTYRYRMDTIRAIGDLQSRYIEPQKAYWEKEEYTFTLGAGPAWLELDEASGLLTGTPRVEDVGDQPVVVRVTASYPHEVPQSSESGGYFQKRRTNPALRRECTHQFVLTTKAAD